MTDFQQNRSTRGVAAALSSSRRLKNFGNEKIFLYLKIAKFDMGGGGVNFGSRRTILNKSSLFKVKPVFHRK